MLGELAFRAQRRADRGQDELHVPDRLQPDPPDAVLVLLDHLGRCLHRQPRLAGAARTGQRQQPPVLAPQQAEHLPEFLLTPDERRGLHRQVRLVQRLERRERRLANLVQRLRRGQVLEPVGAQRLQVPVRDGEHRPLRDEDLPAVPSRADTGRLVHVDADVTLSSQDRLAGMDAHPHADRLGRQRVLGLARREQRLPRVGEGDEEGVALRVDLDPAVRRERRSQRAPVLSQRVCVPLGAQLVQQRGRALDVGEQERDGAGRQIAHQRASSGTLSCWATARACRGARLRSGSSAATPANAAGTSSSHRAGASPRAGAPSG